MGDEEGLTTDLPFCKQIQNLSQLNRRNPLPPSSFPRQPFSRQHSHQLLTNPVPNESRISALRDVLEELNRRELVWIEGEEEGGSDIGEGWVVSLEAKNGVEREFRKGRAEPFEVGLKRKVRGSCDQKTRSSRADDKKTRREHAQDRSSGREDSRQACTDSPSLLPWNGMRQYP